MAGGVGIPSAAFSASPGLRSCVPLIRQFDTAGGTMMPSSVSICERYRWQVTAFHIRGRFLFRYDPSFIRLRRSAPLFACPIRETGRGLFVVPRPVVLVSRSYRLYSGR